MTLTPEQKQMVEDNIELAYFVAHKVSKKYFMFTFDEIVSTCLFSLIKAVQGFDPSKGFAFSTYAINYMKWYVHREANPRKPQVETISLEDLYAWDEDAMSWEGRIPNPIDYEEEILCEIAKEQVKRGICNIGMSKLYKEIFIAHCDNPELTQLEIAGIVGCSQVHVSRAFKAFKDRLQQALAI